MRRAKLTAAVCGVCLAITAAIAWAAPATVTTTGSNTYSAAVFNHDAGTVATLSHTGGGPHDVTSVASSGGQPLFKSNLITSGSTPINGTQFLPAGDYAFYCSFHGAAQMSATLHVIGTPLPRPDSTYSTLSAKKKKCKKKGRRFKRGKCQKKKRKHRR